MLIIQNKSAKIYSFQRILTISQLWWDILLSTQFGSAFEVNLASVLCEIVVKEFTSGLKKVLQKIVIVEEGVLVVHFKTAILKV